MTISEQFVKNKIIRWLNDNDYKVLDISEEGKHGVDIRARHRRYGRYYFIETKGDPKTVKNQASVRENYFVYVLGQIVSRMKSKSRDYYGIGLPISFSKKVFSRIPWVLSYKLHLNVFLVDKSGKIKYITWKGLKKHQKGK